MPKHLHEAAPTCLRSSRSATRLAFVRLGSRMRRSKDVGRGGGKAEAMAVDVAKRCAAGAV